MLKDTIVSVTGQLSYCISTILKEGVSWSIKHLQRCNPYKNNVSKDNSKNVWQILKIPNFSKLVVIVVYNKLVGWFS